MLLNICLSVCFSVFINLCLIVNFSACLSMYVWVSLSYGVHDLLLWTICLVSVLWMSNILDPI